MKNFSWNDFPFPFLKAVLTSPSTPEMLKAPSMAFGDKDFLIPYMDGICAYPNAFFVKRYRREIEDYFLSDSSSLDRICKRLEQLNFSGIHFTSDREEMLLRLRQKRLSPTLSECYVHELIAYGRKAQDTELSLFTEPKTIDLTSAFGTDTGLYEYQQAAVDALEQRFLKGDHQAGILVMPTGSGKTRTSTHFLLKCMVSVGYQVVWLAHRSMLIEQAAQSFYRLSPLVLENDPYRENLKIVCISGEHCSAKALEPDDDVIISSVQSLCRNTEYLPGLLGKKVIIVVDEAHHAIAPSYCRIIRAIRSLAPNAKLLGLTATPVRLQERETKALMQLFQNTIIYSVSMSKLIANGTLATPEYIQRETNVDIEAIITLDEQRYIQKWKEMPESLLEKVAKTNERNELIVSEYLQNREKYGKTLIFALNGIHCIALDDEFRRRGVRSAYVYTLNSGNHEIIERFRDSNRPDGIDVLININMLTEGSDIPDIQTVFLTRPTGSDTLLMQMVGRGMRGLHCGGTKSVNIVDFCDKWSSITRWMNPTFLFEDAPVDLVQKERCPSSPVELIPVDMIRDLVNGITYRNARMNGHHVVLPYGWYDVIDEFGNDQNILVFANQLEGYRQFESHMKQFMDNTALTGSDALKKYFDSFGMLPSEDDLQTIITTIRQDRAFPVLNRFEERDEIDPYIVAQKMKDHMSDGWAFISELKQKHGAIIESLYGSIEAYRLRIADYLLYPTGVVPLGTVVEEREKQFYKFSTEPLPDSIQTLLDEVIQEQQDKLPQPFVRPTIQWTDKDYASYFGIYYHDRNAILINRLLNSVSVPREVVKFVIYHECLHQEFTGHPRDFRRRERMYPDFQKWERFLDYELKDFEREYAL